MWGAIIKACSTLFSSWIDMKKSKHEAEAAHNRRMAEIEQEWDLEAMRNSKYSFKDEFIMMIWYSPLYMGWLAWNDESRTFVTPEEWVAFVGQLPYWWQFGAFGIMAASFGLRWYFKQQNFQIGSRNASKEEA